MRNSNTQERACDRQDFVKKHKKEIEDIMNSTPAARKIHSELFVRLTVRTELQYSAKTNWQDIWVSIVKMCKSLTY